MSGSRPVRALASGLRTASFAAVARALGRGVRGTVDSGGRYLVEGSSFGRDAVATMLVRAVAGCEVEVEEARVNNGPGLIFRRCGEVVAVLAARTLFGRIVDVWVIANPDKLGSWNTHP